MNQIDEFFHCSLNNKVISPNHLEEWIIIKLSNDCIEQNKSDNKHKEGDLPVKRRIFVTLKKRFVACPLLFN